MNISLNLNPSSAPGFSNPMNGSSQLMMMGQVISMMMNLMMNLVSPGNSQGGFSPTQNPAFGSGGSPQSPGTSDFLGGGSSPGTSGSAPTNSAPAANLDAAGGGTDFGRTLAADAGKNTNGPGGRCLQWVQNSLERNGVKIPRKPSAYMVADDLAKHPKFREVQVKPADLPKLPPGAVVVWDKGPGHPHGHISIALGNGREASDKNRQQITNYGTSVRVFMPR